MRRARPWLGIVATIVICAAAARPNNHPAPPARNEMPVLNETPVLNEMPAPHEMKELYRRPEGIPFPPENSAFFT